MVEEKELLKPSNDIVFQALFGTNENNITEDLISDILGKKVKILDIKVDNTIARKYPTEKGGRLDLKTKFEDGTICQIEMQMTDYGYTIERMLYYWARTFTNQIKIGEQYDKLNKTIGIIITNYELKELKGIEELDTKWQIMETKRGKKILTECLELYIIEVPKAKRIMAKEKNNKIAQWITFIENPNSREAKEIMEDNKGVKKAKEVLYVMSEDEELQRLAELKEKWARDEASALSYANKKGIMEVAKKLKKENVDIDLIIKVTELTREEIEKL